MKIVTSELHRKELFKKSDFSGNSVVIPYTSEGALAKLKRLEVVETRQAKREGYNKFNIDAAANGKYINVGNGVLGNSETSDTSDYMQVVANKSYTLSYEYETLAAAGKRGYCYFDENKQYLSGSEYTSSNKSTTFTATADGYIRFAYDKNCTNIMFSEGTEEKPFEPYGVMPSVNYPSEIECVGDNVQLFDKDNANIINAVVDASSITSSAVAKSFYIECDSNETYTVSRKITGQRFVAGTTANLPMAGEAVIDRIVNNSGSSITITTSSNANYLIVYYLYNTSEDEQQILDSIKIEKGSKATSYTKFGQGSVEINTSNKNIAKINENDFELIENVIKNKGRNSGVELTRFKVKKGEKIVVSLTLKSKPTKDTSIVCEINNADVHDSTFYALQTLELNKRFTREIIAEENTEIVYRMWGNANSDIFEFQFSASLNEATDYIEHRGETHIMPIQQAMYENDTFERINGIWYEKHNKVKMVFDGTENWNFNYNSAIFMLDANNILTLSSAETSKLSNFIQSNTYSNKVYDTMYNKETDGIEALNNRINIRESSCSTVAEFKTLLAQRYAENKAIYAVCRLKEPLLLKCTDEQSKVLDKIDTYKDTTIITTDNDLCKISLRYKQSLEAAIKEYTATNVAESEE